MKRFYVYAIVPSAATRDTRWGGILGLAGEPLSLVDAGDVVAVVGEIENPPAATPDAFRGHDEVVGLKGYAGALFDLLADEDPSRRLQLVGQLLGAVRAT